MEDPEKRLAINGLAVIDNRIQLLSSLVVVKIDGKSI